MPEKKKVWKWRTLKSFEDLAPGDLVRHKIPQSYNQRLIVTANYGGRATAVRTADLTNASEWEVLRAVED
jgi:hypothetical protein